MKTKVDFAKTTALIVSFVCMAYAFMTVSGWHDDYKAKQYIASQKMFTGDARETETEIVVSNNETDFDSFAFTEECRVFTQNIADIENEMSTLYSKPSLEKTSEDYARMREINDYFMELFGSRDFQDAWVWYDTTKASAQWTVDTGLNLSRLDNGVTVIPVVFTLRDENAAILGIVTALCDGEALYGAQKHVTAEGVRAAGVTYADTEYEESNTDTDEFLNTIQELAEVDVPAYDGPVTTRTGAILDE